MERRNTSHWLGETEFDGRAHDVITLVMEVGPALSLYFDRETHLLSRSERVLPPFGQIDYRFSNYEAIDGVPFEGSFKLYANDQPNIVIDYAYTKVNRRPPAQSDLQRYFEVTPPTVHQMILTLERLGLLRRQPGQARSLEVLVAVEVAPLRVLEADLGVVALDAHIEQEPHFDGR